MIKSMARGVLKRSKWAQKRYETVWRNRIAKIDDSLSHHMYLAERWFDDESSMQDIFLPRLEDHVRWLSMMMTRSEPARYLPYHMLLYLLTRWAKPDNVVETGVEKGASTRVILEAMEWNQRGRLISVDISDRFLEYLTIPSGAMVREHLRPRWRFFHGDSRKMLPDIFKDFAYPDIFISGSDHSLEVQGAEIEEAWPRIKPGGIMVVDRVDYNDYAALNRITLNHAPSKIFMVKESLRDLPHDVAVLIK